MNSTSLQFCIFVCLVRRRARALRSPPRRNKVTKGRSSSTDQTRNTQRLTDPESTVTMLFCFGVVYTMYVFV